MLTIPGYFISKSTPTVQTTSGVITYPASNNSNRKANAVMLNYNGANSINVNIDGTGAAAGFGFQLSGTSQRQLLFYGLPTLTAIADVASGIEVYLFYIPNLGV